MRVLITGATGLIGKEIGKKLVENGHEVVTVSRDPKRVIGLLPFPTRVFRWGGHRETFPQEALRGVEGIINLAGESISEGRWTAAKKSMIRDSRVIGTRRITEALQKLPAEDNKLKVFVSGSAVGYYGDRSDEVLTENSPGGDDFLARVVHEWEAEAQAVGARLRENGKSNGRSVRVACVRTGVVLSRRGGALAKMLPIFSKGLGGQLANGKQWMSWIHIRDIARLFVFCLENENVMGSVNGTAPEPARNERFTIQLARALGRPVFLPVPEVALKLAFGEMSQAVLGSQRALPDKMKELGFEFEFPELVGALEELGEPLKGGQQEFVSEVWVPHPPKEVFPFFSDEFNLERLTPPFLNFHVVGKSTPVIHEGTLIDYKLKLHGIPMKWQSRIKSWEPYGGFSDVQVKGPYQKWHHKHEFIPMAEGTLLRDRVSYRLPLGVVGDTAAGWRIARDIEQIFSFREKVIREIFGEKEARAAGRKSPEVVERASEVMGTEGS